MRTAKLPLVLFPLLLGATTAAAEPIDLAGAMRIARTQGRAVAAAAARQEAAEARVTQAKGFRLPAVRLEESFIRTDSPAEVFALTLNQERFRLSSLMASDPNHPDPLETAMTRLEIELPLYTGGELSGRIDQAREAARAADATLDWAGNQAAADAATAFIQLAQAREYVELLEHARETVQAHVDLARAYVEQGVAVRSDLLRAEVELSRVDDMLSEARGNARVAEANLAFQLALPQGTSFELAPLGAPEPLEGELSSWVETASQRPDVASARSMLRAAELEIKVLKAAFLPKVGVLARGDLVDDTPFGSHGESTALMARATINLFAGGSDRAALAAARADVRAGSADLRRFEEGVALEVRQAFEQARTARDRRETALRALEAATETERITEERFRGGVLRMLDLLDASNARREAETRELVARADAYQALVRLALASGRAPEVVL